MYLDLVYESFISYMNNPACVGLNHQNETSCKIAMKTQAEIQWKAH